MNSHVTAQLNESAIASGDAVNFVSSSDVVAPMISIRNAFKIEFTIYGNDSD